MARNKDYGFLRVAAATPRVRLADVAANVEEIRRLIDEAEGRQVSLIVFPELCLTGYTCGDLFSQNRLLDAAEEGVAALAAHLRGKAVTVVAGVPVRWRGRLYNCAAVIRDGAVKGLVPKTFLPSYNEFYETRWFASGADFLDGARAGDAVSIPFAGNEAPVSPNLLFSCGRATFAVEICEDLWAPVPPSSWHAVAGAEVLVNLSASNEVLRKQDYRKDLILSQSGRTFSGYVYCSAGYGESTQDLVFAGSSLIAENGALLVENERFGTDSAMIVTDLDVERLQGLRRRENTFSILAPDGRREKDFDRLYARIPLGESAPTDFEACLLHPVDPHPFVPAEDGPEMDRRAREITSIQVMGLMSRLEHVRCQTAVLGISGGLDSTLALLVTVLAFDRLGWPRERILGVTMPGFGTTDRTYRNALDLMGALGVTVREIPIGPAVTRHFQDIGQDPANHDVTYENAQARERTQILMDLANKENGLVVGTGDLSELALGWATYNGDHMSMYGVNAGVPKTLVRSLVRWAAATFFSAPQAEGRSAGDILLDIIDTPISPELTPADEQGNIRQKTEDLVGPYELHDFFLYQFFRLGASPGKILFLARKAFPDYDEPTLRKWLRTFCRRFFSQQFKRSCLPDGPKVGSVSLSPRGDWRMPSDAISRLWTEGW